MEHAVISRLLSALTYFSNLLCLLEFHRPAPHEPIKGHWPLVRHRCTRCGCQQVRRQVR
jgi:hypothetical protein